MSKWLFGNSETAELIRAHDWAATSLGPIELWPPSLKIAVNLVLGSIHAMQLVWGADYTIIYNDAYASLLGERNSNAMGRSLREVSPTIWREIAPHVHRIFSGETLRLEDIKLVTNQAGHRTTDWDCSCLPVRDENGSVAGLLTIAMDATGRVRAERAENERADADLRLQRSEASLRALVTLGAQSIYRMSPNWRVMHELDSCTLAVTSGPLENWPDRYILQEDRARIFAAIERAIAAKSLFEMEHRVRLANGDIGWVLSRAVPSLGTDGTIMEWLGAGIDITDRKRAEIALQQSEARYRTLFDIIEEGFCVCEKISDGPVDFRYVAANPAFARQSGFRDPVGKSMRQFIPAIEEPIMERYGRVVETGQPDAFTSYVAALDLWFEVEAAVADRPNCIMILFRDVTQRKRAEVSLRESEERQAFLLKLSDTLRPLVDPRLILGEACRLLGQHLQVDRAYYVEVDDARGVATVEQDYVANQDSSLVGTYPIASFAWSVDILRRGQSHVVIDTQNSPIVPAADRAALLQLKIMSCMGAPLIKAGALVGALCVTTVWPREWNETEVELVRDVGERIWSAIERSRAETALRKSEDFLRVAIEGGGMGTWLWDMPNETVSGDAVFLSLWGFPPSDEPRPLAEFTDRMSERGRIEMRDMVANAIAAGEEFDGHLEVVEGSGRGRWIRWRGRAERERPKLLFGVSFDVTEQRLSEAALRESEQRYHAQFVASPVPFVVLAPNAPDFTITAANDAYLAATLTTSESLVGRRLFDVFTDDPSRPGLKGSEALNVSLTRVLASRRTDAMPRVRYDLVTPEGGFEPHWWLAINAPVLDDSGNVSAIIHQVNRVTELHLAEEAGRVYQARQVFLLTLSDVLRPLDDADAVKATAARMLGEHLGVNRAFYGEVEGDDWVIPSGYENGIVPLTPGRYSAATYGDWMMATYRQGGVLNFSDSRIDPRFNVSESAALTQFQIVAALGVGLVKGDRLISIFAVHSATPRDWTPAEVELVSTVGERTWAAVERTRAETALRASEERLHVLVAELQHRTRNLIGNVRAIADSTLRASLDLEDFEGKFRDRLAALSRVQGLLSRLAESDRITFDELLRTELVAHGVLNDHAGRVALKGPARVALRSSSVQTLAMALHELATNAVKYGALGQEQAKLAIRWNLETAEEDDPPRLFIDWRESRVHMPAVGPSPNGRGQGRELIEQALPHQLGAQTSFILGVDGVHCTISIPVSARAAAR